MWGEQEQGLLPHWFLILIHFTCIDHFHIMSEKGYHCVGMSRYENSASGVTLMMYTQYFLWWCSQPMVTTMAVHKQFLALLWIFQHRLHGGFWKHFYTLRNARMLIGIYTRHLKKISFNHRKNWTFIISSDVGSWALPVHPLDLFVVMWKPFIATIVVAITE